MALKDGLLLGHVAELTDTALVLTSSPVNDRGKNPLERRSMSPSSADALKDGACHGQWAANQMLPRAEDPYSAMDLGNHVHAVYEVLYSLPASSRTKDKAGALLGATAKRLFEDATQSQAWLDHARPIMEGLWDIEDPTGVTPMAMEKKLSGKIGEVPFWGVADRFDTLGPGALRLVDYKTGKADGVDARGKAKLTQWGDSKGEQLTAYAMIAETAMGVEVPTAALYFLAGKRDAQGNPIGGVARQVDTTDAMMRAKVEVKFSQSFERLNTNLASGRWELNPSPLCAWCPLMAVCPAADKAGRGDPADAQIKGLVSAEQIGLGAAPAGAKKATAPKRAAVSDPTDPYDADTANLHDQPTSEVDVEALESSEVFDPYDRPASSRAGARAKPAPTEAFDPYDQPTNAPAKDAPAEQEPAPAHNLEAPAETPGASDAPGQTAEAFDPFGGDTTACEVVAEAEEAQLADVVGIDQAPTLILESAQELTSVSVSSAYEGETAHEGDMNATDFDPADPIWQGASAHTDAAPDRPRSRKQPARPQRPEPSRRGVVWSDDKPWVTTVNGDPNANGYAAQRAFSMTSLAITRLRGQGIKPRPSQIRALGKTYLHIVLTAQQQVSALGPALHAGVATRLEGALRTVIESYPDHPTTVDGKDVWDAWVAQTTKRVIAVAQAAHCLVDMDENFDPDAQPWTLLSSS